MLSLPKLHSSHLIVRKIFPLGKKKMYVIKYTFIYTFVKKEIQKEFLKDIKKMYYVLGLSCCLVDK